MGIETVYWQARSLSQKWSERFHLNPEPRHSHRRVELFGLPNNVGPLPIEALLGQGFRAKPVFPPGNACFRVVRLQEDCWL